MADNLWDSGYSAGLENGRDEILDFIFGILADMREEYLNEDFVVVSVIDSISHRIDAYIDDMRGVWNA